MLPWKRHDSSGEGPLGAAAGPCLAATRWRSGDAHKRLGCLGVHSSACSKIGAVCAVTVSATTTQMASRSQRHAWPVSMRSCYYRILILPLSLIVAANTQKDPTIAKTGSVRFKFSSVHARHDATVTRVQRIRLSLLLMRKCSSPAAAADDEMWVESTATEP